MERFFNNNPKAIPANHARNRAARSGKITIVTIFALLGMIVMAGFIGNVGHVTTNKIATQNGADSIAFSSAQWMARGMNADTATNHMLGEVTSLVVVIEAVVGPETYEGMTEYTLQNRTLDTINRTLKELAPAGKDTPGIYGEKALGEVEEPLLNKLTDQMAPDDENKAKSKAWATIYDSELELKMDLSKWLLAKTIANLGFFVPPPWGYISAAIAYGVHIYGDVQIAEIAKEWFILEGLRTIVSLKPVGTLKSKIETVLVPALAANGDFIAGRLGKKKSAKPEAVAGVVNYAIGDSLTHLGKEYDLQAFTFPASEKLLMPIEAEPAPSMKGTPRGKDEKEWGKDEVVTLPDADDKLKDIQDNINDSKGDIQKRMQHLKDRIAKLDQLKADVTKLSQADGVKADEKKSYTDELAAIAKARADMQKRLTDLQEQMQKLNKKQAQLTKTLSQLKDIGKSTGNLSANRTDLALENKQGQPQMSEAEERYTQWVRATFPYVDSFRAPVLKMFTDGLFKLPRSEAAKHYEKWTNRYTLIKSWQFRSGYRFKKLSDTEAEWQKKDGDEPLVMYVMQGAYDRDANTGARRDNKGHEVWTQSTDAGKKLAEGKFTIIGLTHHKILPLFSPVIYPNGSKNGTTTFAQAVFYNANEQKPNTDPKSPTQAKIGWDTLNWDPTTTIPEWGNKVATSEAKWPWDIFKSSEDLSSAAKVKLNWQAKLMPVTKTRLKGAVTMPMSVEMNTNVAEAYALFNQMVTH